MPICRAFRQSVWATGLGHEPHWSVWSDNRNAYLQALQETGATGLEPATSGVTGHFYERDMNDDGRRIALFMRLIA
jgi:hypothetical protein